ncbi:hypothetical protein LDENG_00126400 [Lucifuga dentata]|nr:hypothetical protein LDENG_00126400 [Lucifuga dentata]
MGAWSSVNISLNSKYLIRNLSAASKKAITRKWLKPGIPSINDWIDVIYEVYIVERITLSRRLQQDKFEEVWQKWIRYITPIQPSFV